MTRTDRPPETTVDEFVAFIDKLIKTIDTEEEVDCPTERMEFFDALDLPIRIPIEEKTVKKRTQPPPLPPRDEESELELDLFQDSLLPTQF